jgi:hypothetical protein
VARCLKSESESLQRGFEVVRFIDEEGCVLDLLFLAEFTEKQHSELRGSGLKQPHVEEFIGLRINGGVQPVSFVIDLNHSLVDRDLIRSSVTGWL